MYVFDVDGLDGKWKNEDDCLGASVASVCVKKLILPVSLVCLAFIGDPTCPCDRVCLRVCVCVFAIL